MPIYTAQGTKNPIPNVIQLRIIQPINESENKNILPLFPSVSDFVTSNALRLSIAGFSARI